MCEYLYKKVDRRLLLNFQWGVNVYDIFGVCFRITMEDSTIFYKFMTDLIII